MYFGVNANAYVTIDAQEVFLAYAGRNDILRLSREGKRADTIRVPVVTRRGVPEDIAERIINAATLKERVTQHSQVQAVQALPGRLAIVYEDLELEGDLPAVKLHANIYLTILSRSDEPVCVDVPLHSSADARPVTFFAGDQLYVLDRPLEGERVSTVIRRYDLSSQDACSGG